MRIDNTTAAKIPFFMASTTDHRTAVTGITPSVYVRKSGGSFAAGGGSVAEISNGWYEYTSTTTETNTNGPFLIRATGAGADEWRDYHEVRTLEADKSTIDTVNSRIGAPVGASISADIATVDANVDSILLQTGTNGVVLSQTMQNRVADSVLRRTLVNAFASGYGDTITSDVKTLAGLILAVLKSSISGTTLTIQKPDSTTYGTATLVASSGQNNLTSVNS